MSVAVNTKSDEMVSPVECRRIQPCADSCPYSLQLGMARCGAVRAALCSVRGVEGGYWEGMAGRRLS